MNVLAGLGFLLFVFLLIGLFAVPGAWILMILLGALSHVANYPQFALNFWTCYIIVLIISLFLGGSSRD